MPNYKAHLTGGLVSFCLLSLLISSVKFLSFTKIELFQFLISCLIGSLFPDVDTKSKIQKLFYTFLLFLLLIALIYKNTTLFISLSFIGTLPLIVHHRGIFHKPIFIISIALFSILICNLYAPEFYKPLTINLLFFVVGALSHIILDVGFKKFFRI